jgi:hypothetical protein
MNLLAFILHEQEIAQHAVPRRTVDFASEDFKRAFAPELEEAGKQVPELARRLEGISEQMNKPTKSPRPRKGKRKS